jgi:hypothetical protein
VLGKNLRINGNPKKRGSPFGLVPANAATEHNLIEIFQLPTEDIGCPNFAPVRCPSGCVRSGELARVTVQIISNPSSVFAVRTRRRSMTYVRIWGFLDGLLNRRTCLAVAANASPQKRALR